MDINCKYSSTGKIVYDLYTNLNQNGHTAAIAYGRGELVKEKNILKFSSNIEVYFHAFMARITGLNGYFSYFATRRLIHFIEEFKPDVVHLNDMHGYFVNIFTLIKYLKKKKIKTIWTFHCEYMYTGKCGHSDDCEKWKHTCGNCPYLKHYPKSLFFDFTKKMLQDKKENFHDFNHLTIVTPSSWLANRVKQSFFYDREIAVIHNGIDTHDIFLPTEYESLKIKHNITNEKVVLAVAPNIMSENKGGRYVLELAKQMKRESVIFILLGVEDWKLELGSNVIGLEKIKNQKELAAYYSMADVFLICSKKETYSMTCVESLCCGTPVVGFLAGGPESIAIKEYSEFVTYGDIDELSLALHHWLDKKKEITYNIAETARKKYAGENMYEQYLKLYDGTFLDESKKE